MADTFAFGQILNEDLDRGHGAVAGVTLPDGSQATLNKIGLHSFLGENAFSTLDFATIQAALDEIGSDPGIAVIAPNYGGAEFSSLQNNALVVDLRQKIDTLTGATTNIRRPALMLLQNNLGAVTGRELTGTVTMANGSPAVSGAGTAFLSEVAAGDTIKLSADSVTSWAKVSSVTNNNALVLSANYTGAGGSGTAIDGQAQLGLVIRNIASGGSPNTSGAAETVGLTVISERTGGNRSVFSANFNASYTNLTAGGAALEADMSNDSGSDWPDGPDHLSGEDQENFCVRVISGGTNKIQGGILLDAAIGAEFQRGISNIAWNSMGIYSKGRTNGPHLYIVPHADIGAGTILCRDSADSKTVHYISDTGVGFFTAVHMGLDTTSGEDIILTRAAPHILQSDSLLSVVRPNSTDLIIAGSKTGDSVSRFASNAAGLMQWSSGALSPDVQLERSAAGTLLLTPTVAFKVSAPLLELDLGLLSIVRASAADYLMVGSVSGDTTSRYGVTAAGIVQWSAGAGSVDCQLNRQSAGFLNFTGTCFGINTLKIQSGAGSPEAVVTAPPGSLYLDTGGALYVKQAGAGNVGWVLK